jgi:hypothetical protein
MTTFTTDDREEAYKKIVAEAPNQPGYEDAVPIPPVNQKPKELTDEEISKVGEEVFGYSFTAFEVADHYLNFARAILRKAQENG